MQGRLKHVSVRRKKGRRTGWRFGSCDNPTESASGKIKLSHLLFADLARFIIREAALLGLMKRSTVNQRCELRATDTRAHAQISAAKRSKRRPHAQSRRASCARQKAGNTKRTYTNAALPKLSGCVTNQVGHRCTRRRCHHKVVSDHLISVESGYSRYLQHNLRGQQLQAQKSRLSPVNGDRRQNNSIDCLRKRGDDRRLELTACTSVSSQPQHVISQR